MKTVYTVYVNTGFFDEQPVSFMSETDAFEYAMSLYEEDQYLEFHRNLYRALLYGFLDPKKYAISLIHKCRLCYSISESPLVD